MSFSDQQLAVINSDSNRLSVMAVAGSGKSTTMVGKVKHLIESDIPARNIALITFTNEANDSLTDRLEKAGCDVDGLTTKTLHSFCYNLLKIVYNFSGRSRMPKIIQSQNAFLGAFFKLVSVYDRKDENGHYSSIPHKSWTEYYKHVYSYHLSRELPKDLISRLYSCSPNEFRMKFTSGKFQNREAWNILWYLEYESWKESTKQMDFNDMLLLTLRELEKANKQTIDFIKNKYKVIIVDESQDTNALVVDVLKLITDDSTKIIMVGDLRQSIYGFINASPKTILDYMQYEKFTNLPLNTNYRSSAEIIDNSNYFISHYPDFNIGGDAIASKPSNGFPVCSIVSEDEMEEVPNVASLIHKLINDGYKYKDICIMFRTNAQAMLPLHWCVSSNIPFSIKKDCSSIFDKSEMKDILAYLKIINEPNKTKKEDFKRIANKPLRYVTNKALDSVSSITEGEAGYGVDFFNKRHLDVKLSDFAKNLYTHIRKCKNMNLGDQVDYIMNVIGYEDWWNSSEEDNRFFELSIYANAMKKIASECDGYRGLIREINEVRKAIRERNTDDGITFTTVHASKGLEWPVCILLGVCDRVYPFKRAVDENGKEGFEEEARLFYVSSTRPIERMYYSEIVGNFGVYKVNRSLFINQTQAQIIENHGEYYGEENREENSFQKFIENSDN